MNGVKSQKIPNDKNYIINQILSLGVFDELRWLLKTYPFSEIKHVFVQKPAKIYTPS